MAISSISPPPLVITEMTIGGRRYRIEAVVTDRDGRAISYTAAQYGAERMRQLESSARDLFTAHELQYRTFSREPLQLIGANDQGLIHPNRSVSSHDFLIQPLSPEIAFRMGGNHAATIKAQDIWNNLSRSLLTPQFPAPSSPIPTTPQLSATPQMISPDPDPGPDLSVINPPDPASPQPQPLPSPPAQPIQPPQDNDPAAPPQPAPPPPNPPRSRRRIIQATTLQLKNHNFNSPTWYEDIPLRTRFRILQNLRQIGSTRSNIDQRVKARFQAIYDAMTPYEKSLSSAPHLFYQEYFRLQEECKNQPRTLPPATIEAAERFLHRFAGRASEAELRRLMARIHLEDDFFHYFEEQVRAERILAAGISQAERAQWVRAHYQDEIPLFARVLERYLDNH